MPLESQAARFNFNIMYLRELAEEEDESLLLPRQYYRLPAHKHYEEWPKGLQDCDLLSYAQFPPVLAYEAIRTAPRPAYANELPETARRQSGVRLRTSGRETWGAKAARY